ncbi:MAG: nucleoside phosphorylase [Patescibacteria group bacterium]|nr:nucleoside phosphorylase [Patescibacteria group bacterium]
MPYPNLERKYSYPAVFSPQDSINFRRRIRPETISESPEGIILTCQPFGLAHVLSLEDGLRDHYVTEGLYPIESKDNKVGIYLSGFGASHAAVVMEELIARGARRFLNIGAAGSLRQGLNAGDIVVCNRAIRDEGVSHHYLKPSKDVITSKELTQKLKGALSRHGLAFTIGSTWTTDAPFRETQEEVTQYQGEGVLTVEMETAALAAIAQFRGVEFAAAFVVSDLLAEGIWNPQFDSERVVKSLKKLHEASLDVFDNPAFNPSG